MPWKADKKVWLGFYWVETSHISFFLGAVSSQTQFRPSAPQLPVIAASPVTIVQGLIFSKIQK